MKRALKRIAALLLMTAMLITTACGGSTAVAMTIDGIDVNAGEYIFAQIKANNNAIEKFKELNPDVDMSAEGFDIYSQTLEDKKVSDWVIDDAVSILAKRRVYEKKFDELGLSFTPDEISEQKANADATWNNENSELSSYGIEQKTLGLYYESLGISKASYLKMAEADAKAEKVFHAIYDKEGTNPVSEDEMMAEFIRTYFRFRILSVSTSDSEGNEITDEAQLKTLEDMAASYVERLNAGESWTAIVGDYEAYVEAQSADETEETATEDAGDTADADGEAEIEDITEDAEEEVDESIYDYLVTLDEIESYVAAEASYSGIYKRIGEMPVGVPEYMKDDSGYYVLIRLDVSERLDWLEENRESILHALKGEELDNEIAALAGDIAVVRNEAAIKRYNPKKVL